MQNTLLLEFALLDWFHCVEQSVHLPCSVRTSMGLWLSLHSFFMMNPFQLRFCIMPTSRFYRLRV